VRTTGRLQELRRRHPLPRGVVHRVRQGEDRPPALARTGNDGPFSSARGWGTIAAGVFRDPRPVTHPTRASTADARSS
jgi:hypothetical protein